jgi:hypothetical protein
VELCRSNISRARGTEGDGPESKTQHHFQSDSHCPGARDDLCPLFLDNIIEVTQAHRPHSPSTIHELDGWINTQSGHATCSQVFAVINRSRDYRGTYLKIHVDESLTRSTINFEWTRHIFRRTRSADRTSRSAFYGHGHMPGVRQGSG